VEAINFNSSTWEWAWLSNFSRCQLEDSNGRVWASAEHAYQAMKTLDGEERERVAGCGTAAEAKAAGKRVTVRAGWERMKADVMLRILRRKFAAGTTLARRLMETGSRELVHDCPWGDRYWGVCGGEGQNVLGKLLMRVRAELLTAGEAR
jgi:ribA/ribD-fused uncharacterized protein